MKYLSFLILSAPLFAQPSQHLIYVNSTPSGSCSNTSALQRVISTGAVYSCQSGTWAQVGGATVTAASPRYAVQFNNPLGTFAGDVADIFNPTAISVPAVPVLTKNGVGTGTTWGYRTNCGPQAPQSGNLAPVPLGSIRSAEATVSGNTTLDGTHSITIAVACPSGFGSVWRTTAGGTPSSTGLIGSSTDGGTVIDVYTKEEHGKTEYRSGY